MTPPSPEPDDLSPLVAKAAGGDRLALDAVLERFRAGLLQRVGRALPDAIRAKVDPNDLVQETLLEAVEHFASFHYQGIESLRGWLERIADNKVFATYNAFAKTGKRDLGREVRLAAPAAPGAAQAASALGLGDFLVSRRTTPTGAVRRSEGKDLVESLLAKLSPDYREVLTLVRIEGKSVREASEKMRRSENAVKKLLARALEEAQRRLLDQGITGSDDVL